MGVDVLIKIGNEIYYANKAGFIFEECIEEYTPFLNGNSLYEGFYTDRNGLNEILEICKLYMAECNCKNWTLDAIKGVMDYYDLYTGIDKNSLSIEISMF